MAVIKTLRVLTLFRVFALVYPYTVLWFSISAQTSAIQLDRPLKLCWQFPEKIAASIQVSGTTAFFLLSDNTIEAFDVAEAKMIWRNQHAGNVVASPVLINGRLAVVYEALKNTTEGNPRKNLVLRFLSPTTGLTLWQKAFDFNSGQPRFFVFSDTSRIFLLSEESIIALDKTEGSILWTKNFPSGISSFLFADNLILVSSANILLVLSPQNGEMIEKFRHKTSIAGKMDFLRSVVYFGDETGKILAYDLSRRKLLWEAITGASIVSIKAFEKKILVSSNDNFVYLLSARSGNKIWKRRFQNKPVNDLLIYEKFAIVETLDENKLSILSLKTGEVVNQIELEFTPTASPTIVSGILLIPTAKGLKAFANSCN